MEQLMTSDGTQTVSRSKEGLWWRWTHGKNGTMASSSLVDASYDSSNQISSSNKNKAALTVSLSYGLPRQKLGTMASVEKPDSVVSSSLLASSTSPDARNNSSSPQFFSAAVSSCSSCAATVSTKTMKSPLSNRGHRDDLSTNNVVDMTSSSCSVFMFTTREDKRAALSSETSWCMGRSKRLTPRKDRRSSKNSSSMLSNSRAGTRAVAARNTPFLFNVNEKPKAKVPDANVNMFAFSTPRTKPSRRLVRENSNFAMPRSEKAEEVSAAGKFTFDFDGKPSRVSPPTFPRSSPSVATTASVASFSSQLFSSTDPLVNCARAVLHDCIKTRKIEQNRARKRSLEGCFDGEMVNNNGSGWHYDCVMKSSDTGVVSPGSCSSSDDELSQMSSSVDQSFCNDKSERGRNSQLAKEEIYRQILVGDNDFSSSLEFQCFSPLIEERGIPIEIRYQLPLALGTANETSTECTICQLRYGIGDHIVTLPCQHFFHACCVDKWLWNHTSCPLCRTEVSLDLEAEACDSKHNFTECSPVDQERIRHQMHASAQHTGFRPVIPVDNDQLELEMSGMAIDDDSEIEDEPSYIFCPTPRFATSFQDK